MRRNLKTKGGTRPPKRLRLRYRATEKAPQQHQVGVGFLYIELVCKEGEGTEKEEKERGKKRGGGKARDPLGNIPPTC